MSFNQYLKSRQFESRYIKKKFNTKLSLFQKIILFDHYIKNRQFESHHILKFGITRVSVFKKNIVLVEPFFNDDIPTNNLKLVLLIVQLFYCV